MGADASAYVDRKKVASSSRSMASVTRNGRRLTGFFDQEYNALPAALGDLDLVSGLADQIRNVDHRQRIGAMDFKAFARLQRFQRLARLERRQWTFQSSQIESGHTHVRTMRKPSCIVNGYGSAYGNRGGKTAARIS